MAPFVTARSAELLVVILEPALGGLERVAQGDPKIGVGLMIDDDLGSGESDVESHVVGTAVLMMVARSLDRDDAVNQSRMKLLEPSGSLMNGFLDLLGQIEALRVDGDFHGSLRSPFRS